MDYFSSLIKNANSIKHVLVELRIRIRIRIKRIKVCEDGGIYIFVAANFSNIIC